MSLWRSVVPGAVSTIPLAGLLGGVLVAVASPRPALAQCSTSLPAGSVVTCGTQTTRIGQGPGADNVSVTVSDGAAVTVTNTNAISLGNNATITLGTSGPLSGGPAVVVRTTTDGSAGQGQYGDGSNTIDIGSNSRVVINRNASVIATGTQTGSEAINPFGAGNTIINYGMIQGAPSSAIFFQNVNTSAASSPNVVDNFGIIQVIQGGSVNPITGGQAVGSYGNVGIDFINEPGAKVIGNLDLQGGDDHVTLNPLSRITGDLNGGGGNNTLTLNALGNSSDTFTGQLKNFETLNKTGAGTWTLTGKIGKNTAAAPLAVNVIGGTLVLIGDNATFDGSIVINPGSSAATPGPDPTATLEARAQSLPPRITDHGVLLVNQESSDGIQPADGTYAGVVQGTGVLTKIGAGTLTLTGVNTYSGGTNLNVGAIAVAADSALGAPTGPLTFNGGTLQLLSSFDLAATRPIVLNGPSAGLAGGGTIDTNGFHTTIAQSISGAGGLTKAGSGVLTLTAANSYSGDTTITGGTLQLGNGGTTGSIVGHVADNGILAFSRSDVVAFPGVISGTGGVAQIGAGTLTLTGVNTYSGGTNVNVGTIALAADSALGAPTGPLTFNGGTLQLLDSFDLAATRPIILNGPSAGLAGGGTIDTNGFHTTIAQSISGAGGLTKAGSGVLTLTAANSYAGGTTITGGTLQLGNGGTTGSIVGDVADNGILAFKRTDVVTFPGVISGTGGVAQIGTGTTVLNANNPYTGPTAVAAGTLAVGDPAHSTAALSGGGAVAVAPRATLGGYGSVAGFVVNTGTIAVGSALPAFAGGPAGTFTIGAGLLNAGGVNLAGTSVGNTLAVGGNYASPGGTLTLNTVLNAGGPLARQFTDRLLISGNAIGSTPVLINAFGRGARTGNGVPDAIDGISVVQVAGASSPGAFTLPGGFVDGGTPFQYHLYAYGPGSPNGPAAASQSLVGNGGNQWDYRLQTAYVTPEGPVPPEPVPPGGGDPPLPPNARPEVAPQVPAYVTTPTALFNAGFQDIDSLHRRLGEIRDDQQLGRDPQGEAFVRVYGTRLNYTTNRSFTGFGVDSSQDYAATQFGGNRIAVNNDSGTLRVGLAGTLGRLWFQPSAVDGASKGLFNSETLAGLITWQSRAGWYVDAIVSGGMFDGTVSTPNAGETTGMNGTSLAGSIEAGYPIALGWQALTVEPQVQFVYQRLNFAQRTDVSGIAVDLGNPSEGVFRGGARLIRQFADADGMLFTPYLKANVLQGIGGGDPVHLSGYSLPTGVFGTALQVGGGVTGTLTRNLSVYGDVAWQQNVGGGGGSRGWAFNGGLRYVFGAPAAAASGAAAAPAPAAARSYLVFFDWDRAELTDRARQVVAEAAAASGRVQLTRILVNGYTDTSGTPHYNQGLSVRRAEAVAAELVRDGVPRSAISVRGFGETRLLVPTGANVREPQNRRVEIVLP